MRLLSTLHTLIEQTTPWYDKVFQSQDHEDIVPLIKLFGGDIHELYNALDSRGQGKQFLNHILNIWPYDDQQSFHLINALGGIRDWNNGMMDNDLVDEYIVDPYLEDMRDTNRDEKGRIILELMAGEEADFFSGSNMGASHNCYEIAKQIFGDEGLEWEDYNDIEKIETLINDLSPENYVKLVRHIGTEFHNQEVDAWREEYDEVREENGKVLLTPGFMNGFLPDNESTRYNLAVLIGNTPELDEVEGELNYAYSRAWNDVVINQYYSAYQKAFDEFLGKPIGVGSTYTYPNHLTNASQSQYKKVEVPVKYFDVTDRARAMIVRHAYEIDSPEHFTHMIKELELDILCPHVDEYPYNQEEVDNLFQDYLWDYL